MGKGTKSLKRSRSSRVNKGSDGSDEDYVLEEDEVFHESEEEENYDVVEEEEDEEEREVFGFKQLKVEKVKKKKLRGRKAVKRSNNYYEDEGEGEEEVVSDEDDEEFTLEDADYEYKEEVVESRTKRKVSMGNDLKVKRSFLTNKSRRTKETSVLGEDEEQDEEEEEEEEDDYNTDSDDDDDDNDGDYIDDDEEYNYEDDEETQAQRKLDRKVKQGSREILRVKRTGKRNSDSDEYDDYDFDDGEEEDEDDEDEEFSLEEDEVEELHFKKKIKKVRKPYRVNKLKTRKSKKKRKSKVAKKPSKRNKLAKMVLSSDDDFQSEKSKKKTRRRKKKSTRVRKLDFVCSDSSDLDSTINDKELLRETKRSCGPLRTSFRNSSYLKSSQNQQLVKCQHEERGKGKEKLNELSNDFVKQTCGICLSEEGNRTVRGTLNSCSHFYCFACIMEWSKVESRCPACKRRFVTISKSSKLYTGKDPRNSVIQVPERDQIYQPSEEELMRYLNPYENVVCVECQQDGDDSVMLLCDICDSPAHTYCVGLGRNVPEGNWYCRSCSLGTLNPEIQYMEMPGPIDQSSGQQMNGDEAITTQFPPPIPIDQQSFSRESGLLRSPREELHASSPSGVGSASTLSGRRIVQQHIQMLLSQNRTSYFTDEILHHADRRREAINSEIQQHEQSSFAVRTRDTFLDLDSQLRQVNQIPSNTDSANETSHSELDKISPISGTEQLGRCSRRPPFPSNASNIVSPYGDTLIMQGESAREQEHPLRKTT